MYRTMKRLMFIIVLLTLSLSTYAQTRAKIHTVKRGETIESVAKKYGVEIYDLINANPQADGNYYYPGMKLLIPEKRYTMEESTMMFSRNQLDSRQGKGAIVGEASFQYLLFGGGTSDYFKSFRGGLSTNIGYRYYVHHNVFLEGSCGYRWYTFETIDRVNTTVHNITMPIHLGCYIDVTEKLGLRPFFGPRVDFPVATRMRYGGYSYSADTNIGVTLEFGLDLHFVDWGIRAKYGLGVGDYKNMNYVSIGITYGL